MEEPPYFPLRWESSGQQWWYATPIDFAAANGQYDVVRALLATDTSLLIKLTSLRRIRRLETLWHDLDKNRSNSIAKSRSHVAKLLLSESAADSGENSLIKAGYGGWLLYTAASAGDLGFVRDLLHIDPLLVFGEGEYGISDLLFAAARSGRSEVFRALRDSAIDASLKGEICEEFEMEMMNRAVHCAAKGGNLEALREVLDECDGDVLGYRDAQGSTILHSAAGNGQVEVVESLIASRNIINATDHQGNTALHIAAYKGFFPVLNALLVASPSVRLLKNDDGNTILHMAVAGFRAPGFHCIDRQLELVKQLVLSEIAKVQDLINVRNNEGKTAIQLAMVDNVRFDVVDLLMKVPCIDLDTTDCNGGFGCLFHQSPGSSFNVPDSEIFTYAKKSVDDCSDFDSAKFSELSDEDRMSSELLQCRTEVTPLRQRFVGNGKRGNLIPSPRSPFSRLFFSSPTSVDGKLGVSPWSSEKSFDVGGRKSRTLSGGRSIFSRKLMSRYVCFRSQGLAVEDSIGCKRPGHLKRNSVV